jgi:single-stranded-DNA-specific exonuclease
MNEIERLAPYGPGHVEPLLAVTGLRVGDARRIGAGGEHLALRLLKGNETLDAVAFGVPAERPVPEPGTRLDVVGTLEHDRFGGLPRLRIRVQDYADAGASPLLARRRAAAVPVPVGEAVPAG